MTSDGFVRPSRGGRHEPRAHRLVFERELWLPWADAHSINSGAAHQEGRHPHDFTTTGVMAVTEPELPTPDVPLIDEDLLIGARQLFLADFGAPSESSAPWVRAAYAGEQSWTRDPRGSQVRRYSPRIPHGKVSQCRSTVIRPCQGAIIG